MNIEDLSPSERLIYLCKRYAKHYEFVSRTGCDEDMEHATTVADEALQDILDYVDQYSVGLINKTAEDLSESEVVMNEDK